MQQYGLHRYCVYTILVQVQLFFTLSDLKMTRIYLTVITADNDTGMFHSGQSLQGFTYNVIIFDKIQNMPMCMCYMLQKQMETLTVATMKLIHTRTSLEFYMHAIWLSCTLLF